MPRLAQAYTLATRGHCSNPSQGLVESLEVVQQLEHTSVFEPVAGTDSLGQPAWQPVVASLVVALELEYTASFQVGLDLWS